MKVSSCRVCTGGPLHLFLDLGDTALANSFLRPDRLADPEPRFPLRVVLCGQCGLVQIDEEVAPEILFKNYIYVSGTSSLIHSHAADLAARLVNQFGLMPGDLVVEAASNDGTVLKKFQQHGVRTLGIDPAANIVEQANRAGVETLCDFFNPRSAAEIRASHGPARLVLARHVLAHAADLHGFVKGFDVLLDQDGLAVVEVPYLRHFHDNLEYDTVYHEHLCYYSVRVLDTLFGRFGMQIVDVREVAIHGGSIVVAVQRRGGQYARAGNVKRLLHEEEKCGLHRLDTWQLFAQRVADSKAALLAEIDRLRAQGQTLAGYGAPAKGMTLLAYCGLGPERLPYLVDRSPHKQGLLTPGHHIPVLPVEQLTHQPPNVLLVMAWNFAAEVVRQQADFQRRGGRFLLPIPFAHYWKTHQAAA
jgi:hypothetical protein